MKSIASTPRWRAFLLGLLDSAATYVVVGGVTLALHRTGLRLPGPLDSQLPTLAVLLGVTASLLVGRFHQTRENEDRAAGVFAGTALWPIVALLIVLSRFFITFAGGATHGS